MEINMYCITNHQQVLHLNWQLCTPQRFEGNEENQMRANK